MIIDHYFIFVKLTHFAGRYNGSKRLFGGGCNHERDET